MKLGHPGEIIFLEETPEPTLSSRPSLAEGRGHVVSRPPALVSRFPPSDLSEAMMGFHRKKELTLT